LQDRHRLGRAVLHQQRLTYLRRTGVAAIGLYIWSAMRSASCGPCIRNAGIALAAPDHWRSADRGLDGIEGRFDIGRKHKQ